MTSAQAGRKFCVGRFEFTVPGGLAMSGGSQSIYRVKVSTSSLAGTDPQKIIAASLARLRPLPSGASPVVRSFDLLPGVPAVWYIPNPRSPNLLELMAVRRSGDHAVTAIRGGEASKTAGVEKLVTNVLNAYVPDTAHGFCVGHGAITSEPGVNEDSLAVFSHRELPEFELEFSTRTVDEPDTETYSNLDEERQVAAGGGSLTVLAERWRSAAGLRGKEFRLALEIPGKEKTLRFTWHFPGVADSSSQPAINFVGRARGEQQAALETAWETALGSFRMVPVAQ